MQIVDAAFADLGRIDVVVSNAGYAAEATRRLQRGF
jgi:NAD(P)-dependent dehydrogenase (short-subunit alcohol dehydrogenase family)